MKLIPVEPEACDEVVRMPLRARSSRAVRAMLAAMSAVEGIGVQDALDQGFEMDAQVLWIDDEGVIVLWPPPPVRAHVILCVSREPER